MNTSLSHLQEYKQKQPQEIAAIIVQSVASEKVILLVHNNDAIMFTRYLHNERDYLFISG